LTIGASSYRFPLDNIDRLYGEGSYVLRRARNEGKVVGQPVGGDGSTYSTGGIALHDPPDKVSRTVIDSRHSCGHPH
jgi:hypothetical protein